MSIVNTPILQRLWYDANQHPEWATTRLWEYLFYRVFFSGDQWLVSSQQPPTHQPGELRRVDLVVENMSPGSPTLTTILFMEAKRASAGPKDVLEVEWQAYTAACAYAVDTDSMDPIWTMTCVGSQARVWIFHWDNDFLVPFFPETHGHGEISEYIDIAHQGRDLHNKLDYIKKHPIPPKHLLKGQSSPRPTEKHLPVDWHAQEVEMRDLQHQHAENTSNTSAFTAGHPTQATPSTQYPEVDDVPIGWHPAQATSSTQPCEVGDVPNKWQWQGTLGAQHQMTKNETEMTDIDYGEKSTEGASLDPSTTRQYGQNPTLELQYDDAAEGSTAVADTNTSTDSGGNWLEVEVKKKHGEYSFRDSRGQKRTTRKDQWERQYHDGRPPCWVYRGKTTSYYTYTKPGS